jgi:hypothetical protein
MKNRAARIVIGALVPLMATLMLGHLWSSPAADRPFYTNPTRM